MALHMIKLCVGAENVEDLAEWQDKCVASIAKKGTQATPWHDTRMSPKRAAEMLDGGSLYWVIKHFIIVRQRLVGFEEFKDKDGKSMCRIHLDSELIRTKPRKKRPFQGWRYLEPGDAPSDLDGKGPALSADLELALKEALAW
ncbi:MAG: DUF1489 domain-containing protein [Hyphomonadaceae bacterium]|jgi:hypothetical protein|nr:DUF1489 domain-containing protein [Hyphomonadaceae bacterium]